MGSLFKPSRGRMQGKHSVLITDANPGDAFDSKAFPFMHALVWQPREKHIFPVGEDHMLLCKSRDKIQLLCRSLCSVTGFQHPHLREVPGMN